MRVASLLLLAVLLLQVEARKKDKNLKVTVADEVPPPKKAAKADKKSSARAASPPPPPPKNVQQHHVDDDNSIDDVDEDRIDEILRDATKNLVIFLYDGKVPCPTCAEALSEVEEIDDDIEATGYVQVVKTDDRAVARELGINTFPALVYFRRKNPILYDGDFKDSETVLRWLRSHDEVATLDLTDDNFETRTDSHSPDEGALDWFVMFYDADEGSCNSFIPLWETVAHKLRGLVNVGKVETSVNDDVSERFHIDDKDCPAFLLFHRGKVYRYKDSAKDVRSLTNFALHKYKEQRGHRVPEPPTAIEHLYEFTKEKVLDIMDDSQMMSVIGVGGLILVVAITLVVKAYPLKRRHENAPSENCLRRQELVRERKTRVRLRVGRNSATEYNNNNRFFGGVLSTGTRRNMPTSWEKIFDYTSQHNTYDDLLRQTINLIFYAPGALSPCVRHYIALMAATRHRCFFLIDLHRTEFLREGGDPDWLQGLTHSEPKLMALDELNMILAHQPWMCTANLINGLARLGSPSPATQWTLAELTQAVVIMAQTHVLCSFVYAIGDIEPTNLAPAEMQFLKCDDEEYVARNKENSQESIGEVEELLRRMENLETTVTEGAQHETTFNNAISDGSDSTGGDSPESDDREVDVSLPVFSTNPQFGYVDFNNRRDKSIKTFKIHEFSWDHGFNLISERNHDLGSLLDAKFALIQKLTYSFMGTYTDVNTRKYRMAVWNYIQALYGIRYDDYEYSEVNVLLDRPTKTFIKHVACSPHKLNEDLRHNVMNGFKISEKVHVILMVIEARLQATMLHFTRALTNFYTLTIPKGVHLRPLD
ncbi:unnamed protein product [Caenorhabditis auriculariae]|uniref:Thioredoxin domain-containing protein n=1 Tax=Caenorhabditis auriculariae TaxID=2777116 RepID=A0A8S1HJW9_9PELO|nr:unnamed protein product [Caenorhabditis auriculariae]